MRYRISISCAYRAAKHGRHQRHVGGDERHQIIIAWRDVIVRSYA